MQRKKDAILQNLRQQSAEVKRVTKQLEEMRQAFEQATRDEPSVDVADDDYMVPARSASSPVAPAPVAPPAVGRDIHQGPRGGLYYMGGNNRKVYLRPGQCNSCVAGNLAMAASGCPPAQPKQCAPSKNQLKARIRRLSRRKAELKRERAQLQGQIQRLQQRRRR